ncbi:hypothetical protein NRIC_07390 [Enterococcus florum]|uniref:DUF3784 domain-containing protein n=1 Tax=Enterococcus florum TaxID=2480627 RepID=A0A4P5PA50_9ENTE|nr:DUF3784 domain-containing protein [Enterococcus florum]GCF92848.1 hypothetical protein NRIC_07390 [Enterococcus florum]
MNLIDYFLLFSMMIALLIAGIQLLRGKWLMLIAGYNTMTKEERQKVNGRNAGKLVGNYLIFLSLIILLSMTDFVSSRVLLTSILMATFLVLLLTNTSKHFKC